MSETSAQYSNHDNEQTEERILGKAPSELVLCFLSCPQDAAKGYVGAMMVTDARARPMEFAFVEPVRPTTMQRIVYGKTLEEHVRIDVIAKKLLSGNSSHPDVIFVDSEELLAVRRLVNVSVAKLARNDDQDATASKLSTLTYKAADRADDELAVGQVIGCLEPLIDLIEPFNRIKEALKESLRTSAPQGKQ